MDGGASATVVLTPAVIVLFRSVSHSHIAVEETILLSGEHKASSSLIAVGLIFLLYGFELGFFALG